MNKWRITFIFLAGVWLHEFLSHVWLTAEGILPFTSRFLPWPVTADMNVFFIAFNLLVFLVFAYLGFFYPWERNPDRTASAMPR